MDEMNQQALPKRTIDEYNASVGINENIISTNNASIGVYKVRNALKNPTEWHTYLQYAKVDYSENGVLSNEQKWMTFLVQHERDIGLYDLGEAEGLTRIKSKRRFEKNITENEAYADWAKTFSEEEVHEMLSFGTDIKAAEKYYNNLDADKQIGLNLWIRNAFFRRTSKLGIDFATSNKGLNARVHFNLTSGIQQENGSRKPKLWGILDDIAKDRGTRKITESEWRYAKKMMEKDPQLRQRIMEYSEHK